MNQGEQSSSSPSADELLGRLNPREAARLSANRVYSQSEKSALVRHVAESRLEGVPLCDVGRELPVPSTKP